jgi:hypothetical protein
MDAILYVLPSEPLTPMVVTPDRQAVMLMLADTPSSLASKRLQRAKHALWFVTTTTKPTSKSQAKNTMQAARALDRLERPPDM